MYKSKGNIFYNIPFIMSVFFKLNVLKLWITYAILYVTIILIYNI